MTLFTIKLRSNKIISTIIIIHFNILIGPINSGKSKNISAPLSKTPDLHLKFIQTTFFYLERFLKKLADDQCSSMTNTSTTLHLPSTLSIQPFTTAVD